MSGETCRALVPGTAAGEPFATEPFSFWGGFDSGSGRIVDRFHSHSGTVLTGRIVFMERGRGSSSGASVLAEAIRLKTAPAALCLRTSDAIIATGAMVAWRLYRLPCPVLVFDDGDEWSRLSRAGWLHIDASRDRVQLDTGSGAS